MINCPACAAPQLDIEVRCQTCGEPLITEEARRRIGTTVLDSYTVVDVLGQGGMSVVYRARHQLTDQEVALKILPAELAANSHVKSRFLEEARALAQLDHPGIVHLYNFGTDGGCLVLAMQLVAGQTWERMIMSQERLGWRESVAISIAVLEALEAAHARGIIHRDMKPSNVLVRPDGSALVTDFGIAKVAASTRLTATGQTMGTVRYMSPEQVRGQEVDARSDVYSLSVTLYESLCGDTPFDGESHFDIMAAHLQQEPRSLARRGVLVPPALERLVMSGLAKEPEARPASAAAMRASLEQVLADAPPLAPSEPRSPAPAAGRARAARVAGPAARPRPIVLLSLGVLALAAAAVTAFLVSNADRPPGAGQGRAAAPVRPAAPRALASGRAMVGGMSEAEWPEPHLISGLVFAVDERFESDRLRVLSVTPRDATEMRALVLKARRDFSASLPGHGVTGRVGPQPLTIVVVPRATMCDGRIYERGQAPAGCESSGSWYRPREKTLYLADDQVGFAPRLTYAVAVGMCLHSDAAGCDAAAVHFGQEELERAHGK